MAKVTDEDDLVRAMHLIALGMILGMTVMAAAAHWHVGTLCAVQADQRPVADRPIEWAQR